jgi:hypothetical protein
MKNRKKIAFWLLSSAVLLCIGMAIVLYILIRPDLIKTGEWRYKTTVYVQTPEGLKSGYAVRRIQQYTYPDDYMHQSRPYWLSMLHAYYAHYRYGHFQGLIGEAVRVDLGERGQLFALMKGYRLGQDYGSEIVRYIFPFEGKPGGPLTQEGLEYYKNLKDAKTVLNPLYYPVLVRFQDIKDPKTVELVYNVDCGGDPMCMEPKISDEGLTRAFGEGVKIERIEIEMTDEPVTEGMEKLLIWLPARNKQPGALGGDPETPFQDPTGLYLTGVDFLREKEQ